MKEFDVVFRFPMTIEAESEDVAKEKAKSVLFDHLGQITLKKRDFEVLDE